VDIINRWHDLNQKPPVKSQALARVPEGFREISYGELVTEYEIVEANGDYMLVTPVEQGVVLAEQSIQLAAPYSEIGSTGIASNYNGFMREEYNAELRDQLGMRKYDKMRRSDASVRSALRLIKTPILSARWFIQPQSESSKDVEIAQHVHHALFHYMSISWTQVLWEALLMLDFGHYAFEKVYIEYDGKMYWQKLAPRHPLDEVGWVWDSHGGPVGIRYVGPDLARDVYIPVEKLAVFSFDREAGDLRGISALRSAYKHWYFKENLYKIDAIQKERHGVGVPIIKLPPGYSPQDRVTAHELGRNLRSNEKAHVVLPPFWEVMFAKLEGQPVSALESAEHHSNMIFQNILAEFMTADSASSDDAKMEIFLKSTRYIAEIIRDVFNMYCIPQLVDMNYDVEPGEYPELRVRRIGDTQDWRMISFALRNLIGAQVIQPDDRLDEWAREEMDLPRADPTSAREPPAPQNPGGGTAGPPRQSQAANQKPQKGVGAGQDSSGRSGIN